MIENYTDEYILKIIKWQRCSIAKYHLACIQNKPDHICILYGQAMDFVLTFGTTFLGENYVPIEPKGNKK